jgi:DNA-directed RNA polymerase alpha subunit
MSVKAELRIFVAAETNQELINTINKVRESLGLPAQEIRLRPEPTETQRKMWWKFDKPTNILPVSIRTKTCCKNEGLLYVGQVVQRSEEQLLNTPNFGRRSLSELEQALEAEGLSLGTNTLGWEPPPLL